MGIILMVDSIEMGEETVKGDVRIVNVRQSMVTPLEDTEECGRNTPLRMVPGYTSMCCVMVAELALVCEIWGGF